MGDGADLSSMGAVKAIADNPRELAAKLQGKTGEDLETIEEKMMKWREGIQEAYRLEAEAKAKKKVPIWRCAVCGRYGCPVAPYIESYRES